MTTEQMDWLDDERAGRHRGITPGARTVPPVRYPERPRLTVTESAQVESPSVQELLRRIQRDLMDEDARMRSEVLPDPPEGWAWVCEIQTASRTTYGEVTFRLVYRLEATA